MSPACLIVALMVPVLSADCGFLGLGVTGQDGQSAPPVIETSEGMTVSEAGSLRTSIMRCWNVGALTREALSTTVVVGFKLTPDGRPDVGSIEMLRFDGGSEAAARQAYEAARRAIIRCGAKGFDLPPGKYERWKQVEMTFNPERMRIK